MPCQLLYCFMVHCVDIALHIQQNMLEYVQVRLAACMHQAAAQDRLA